MAIYTLIPHPDFPPLAVKEVSVEVERRGGELCLHYRVEGAGELVWPEPAAPGRMDELWKATCFELFVKPDGGEGYAEFNFSPSGRWAAYAFDGYRAGMRDLPLPVDPRIERRGDGVTVSGLDDVNGRRIALTAVIEETGGRRSFWSLAHPPGAPDFHRDDCFVARLPAPEAP
ncbi:DOMON-like domain-containing protein [Sphingomonas sp. CL5.1]|uniref:DOMON-like domain-containing protein n=1 Tax=Sphingomonas sp. CL5.1 TaxID=2653203 RepID=UPI001582DF5D|nr:DOMON-like domain-containing protein [Sphingomonas sp. CL5.1]QKS01515.1 DOMON-like domain-containing protein [Sphingomonas sp. CL5.1]